MLLPSAAVRCTDSDLVTRRTGIECVITILELGNRGSGKEIHCPSVQMVLDAKKQLLSTEIGMVAPLFIILFERDSIPPDEELRDVV